MDILREAGLPEAACQLLQGGGELGAYLVRHPAVHIIAFTGSREVGLEILRAAYDHQQGQEHVKRVISREIQEGRAGSAPLGRLKRIVAVSDRLTVINLGI